MDDLLRISDILKKYKEEKYKSNHNDEKKPAPEEANLRQKPHISIYSAVAKDLGENQETNINAQALYDEALSRIKEIYTRAETKKTNGDFYSLVLPTIEKLADALIAGNRELLRYSLSDYSQMSEYLFAHPVNVCIISLYLAIGLDYPRSRLIELGISALIHDVGMPFYAQIVNQGRILNNAEFARVKEHPQQGYDVLQEIGKGLSPIIYETVRQEHERWNGSGYPLGLKAEQINPYAQVVGLVDVYEAMTHTRPYRRRHNAMEVIREILHHKDAFNSSYIKVLIERIGIFPVGWIVQLNTKEIAVVVKANPRMPLRPVVDIVMDSSGKELQTPKKINLAEDAAIYIEQCLECLMVKNK